MEGLFLIPMGLLWLAWGFLIGRWVYSWKRNRWHQALATVFALWLPLWDLIPGYLLYKEAIREVGGIRIYRTVEAEGYLDRMAILGNCWKQLRDSRYRYCENYEPNNKFSQLGPLNAVAGFYEYRLAPIDAPDCAPFRELNVKAMQESYHLGDQCVVATRRDEPVSRYEYERGSGDYAGLWPIPSARIGWYRVRDRMSNEVVAQATQVTYRPWIMRSRFGVPIGWIYARDELDRPIFLTLKQVIRPKN